MSAIEIHFLVMPFVLAALGGLAVYLHGRADDASRRAEAAIKRSKG